MFKILLLGLCWTLGLAGTPHAQPRVMITQDSLVQVGPLGWIAPNIAPPTVNRNASILGPKLTGDGATLLRRLWQTGQASGFDGVFYENRDRNHSPLDPANFPQLAHIKYGPKLSAGRFDWGLGGRVIFPAIVIGNSSTAITRFPVTRSQTRQGMTTHLGPERAFLTYTNNHLYIYPEHKDHDDADLFPANWPYTVTSQGSSFSDRPFFEALLMTVAALPPETKEFLRERRLVAPTLQMIMRRSQKGIDTYDAYLSGIANPPVFRKERLDPARMVALATSLLPQDVPPMVRLNVTDETFGGPADLLGLSEVLFDTPSAIARVWRSHDYTKTISVSAADTKDPNGRDLTYHWVLLQGDRDKVRIQPESGAGARAELNIDWHGSFNTGGLQPRMSDRVDVGVFAWNGVHYSAPAIISISFSNHHSRLYEPQGPDGQMKLVSIDYAARRAKRYFDPKIHWHANWRDEYTYDDNGDVVGLTRHRRSRAVDLPLPNSAGHPDYEVKRKKEFVQLKEVKKPKN